MTNFIQEGDCMESYLLTEQDRSTLQSKVTNKLREVILTGHFNMGDRLVQEEWADKLGVSRMPIREALVQLEKEGLVRIEPRRGAIVTPISVEDIKEIYQLRVLLEGEAVERALPYIEEEDIKELSRLDSMMRSLGNTEEDVEIYMRLNIEFHHILRRGCPWRRIHDMIDTLWKGIPPYTPSLLAGHLEETHKEHGLMIVGIKQRDAKKLRKVIERHILRTRDNLIQVILEAEKETNRSGSKDF